MRVSSLRMSGQFSPAPLSATGFFGTLPLCSISQEIGSNKNSIDAVKANCKSRLQSIQHSYTFGYTVPYTRVKMAKDKKASAKPEERDKAGLVRIRESDKRILQQMANEENAPMPEILRKALEAYRRQKFFESVNHAYQAVKKDPKAWQQEDSERDNWELMNNE